MTRRITLIIVIAAALVFSVTFYKVFFAVGELEAEVPPLASTTPAVEVPESAQPATLLIPTLDIEAKVQYVGVTASGNMGVPSNFRDVGWYKYGTVPGQKGSAVIDGHVDNGLGLSGVFKNLEQLKVGDSVYVLSKAGERQRFMVTDVVTYNYKEVPGDKLFERSDSRRLNLVTCGGSWIKSEKTYDQRVVVYTVLVP